MSERVLERDRSQAAERSSQAGEPGPNEGLGSEGRGQDAYGCVDWFDYYCPLPRTDPAAVRVPRS